MRGQPIVASRAAHLPEMNYDILHTLSAIKKSLGLGRTDSIAASIALARSFCSFSLECLMAGE